MKTIKIKIEDESYPIKFGYGSLRLLGEYWGVKGFQEVGEKVNSLIPKTDGEDISFEMMSGIGAIVKAGITNAAKEDVAVSVDEIVDALFENMSVITTVFELFVESMPKAEEKRGKSKPKPKRK